MSRRRWGAIVGLWLGSALTVQAADPLYTLAQKLKQGLKPDHETLVAVLDFTYPGGCWSTGSYLVSERLVTYLVQSGVPLVERRHLERILEEKKWRETGFVAAGLVKKTENISGVDAVVVGSLSDLSDEKTQVVARLIHVESGKVLAAATVIMARVWLDAPRPLASGAIRLPLPLDASVVNLLQRDWTSAANTRTTSSPSLGQRQKLGDQKPRRPYRPAPMPFLMLNSNGQF